MSFGIFGPVAGGSRVCVPEGADVVSNTCLFSMHSTLNNIMFRRSKELLKVTRFHSLILQKITFRFSKPWTRDS